MIKKYLVVLILFSLLLSSAAFTAAGGRVEIFDPKINMVVKKITMNTEVRKMVESWLKNIKEIHPLLSPIKDDGYAVRFTFLPQIYLENDLIKLSSNEVYLIIPEKDPPFFLIFNEENQPLCFKFPGNLDLLSKALSFTLTKN